MANENQNRGGVNRIDNQSESKPAQSNQVYLMELVNRQSAMIETLSKQNQELLAQGAALLIGRGLNNDPNAALHERFAAQTSKRIQDQEATEKELLAGPRHWKIGLVAHDGRVSNKVKIVGGRDESEATNKYAKYFGINRTIQPWQKIECDKDGNPLPELATAE